MGKTDPGTIVVVGPGALGCLLAAALDREAPGKACLLDHDAQRAALLRAGGISLETAGGPEWHAVPVFTDPGLIGPAQMILLCVKTTALPGLLPTLAPLASGNTLLLAFQNGMDHIASLQQSGLAGAWGLAVTTAGAHLIGPGQVRLAGAGRFLLGFSDAAGSGARATLALLTHLLNRAGLPAAMVPDIMTHVWNKLLINAGINALSALYRCSNGELLKKKETSALLAAAVEEGARVARALGIAIAADPTAMTREVCRATADNLSSMLQDVRRQKKTEIEAINGAIVREAERLGLAAPVNQQLFREVQALEDSYPRG